MNELSLVSQAAFQPGNTADIADALIVTSGLRVDAERRRGRGAGLNPDGRFELQQRVASKKIEGVRVVIDRCKGLTQFGESCGAQAAEQEIPPGAQHPPGFCQSAGGIAPLPGQTGPVQIDTGRGQWQALQIALYSGRCRMRTRQHGGC